MERCFRDVEVCVITHSAPKADMKQRAASFWVLLPISWRSHYDPWLITVLRIEGVGWISEPVIVGRLIRSQEQDGVLHLIDFSRPAHWNEAHPFGPDGRICGATRCAHRRHDAGVNRVGTDIDRDGREPVDPVPPGTVLLAEPRQIGSAAEEPLVCMTHRWREMDSNHRFRGRRPASS